PSGTGETAGRQVHAGGGSGARSRRPGTADDPLRLDGQARHPLRPGHDRARRGDPRRHALTPLCRRFPHPPHEDIPMKRSALALAAVLSLLPLSTLAHKQWLVPSSTVVAGQDAWVTVDAAVSNQLYYPDHVAMRLDNIVITAPDGSTLSPQNPATGKYRSVFDVQLAQEGTYRISNVNNGLSARWEGADGKPASLRRASAEDLANKVPKDAKNLQVTQSFGRVETFVTNGT